ncbi:DEAD/DEAH box helicase [Psychroflexus planctonicus]|uniref:RNA helicase n=1 Tax=Psychroflexus planctonicus TaxID=1526575 RepID=A0ABQ1SLS5_9FLAO|nr:DEAD/DEAH box helicase [Psychroflexus planctonicus]GGE43257.1 DEAD/DEAH box helicase [Psychroflexus planctonicus]
MTNFSELGLQENILKAISDLGFESPSEVQAQAIPILLEKETDLVALAQTGTGKTAAFGFPLIQKINFDEKFTQGLILSPTRELCLQITNEFQHYGKYSPGLRTVAVYGGASITDQEKQIKKGAQIIVATPGRMKDMLKRGMIDISKLAYCILDEADEMLNMGFYEDIIDILSHSPKEKSTWLFSATMPKEVASIAKKFMNNPREITVGQRNVSTKSVSHEYFLVSARDRYNALKRLVDVNPEVYACVFCRTKRDTQKVAERLIEDGYNAAALHGDLSQSQRDMVMKSFRNKQVQILVATDVAARGIDVDDITHVINYQLPDEVEIYTHRSGRTGRAGKTGKSLVILTKSELRKIKQIERIIGQKFTEEEIPTGEVICEKQLFHLVNQIKDTEVNHKIDEYLPKLEEKLMDLSKEDLIKKFFSVEFTRFYNYYKDADSINKPAARDSDYESRERSDETRFFINLGEKDGFNWMQLKDFLKEQLQLDRDGVAKVDVKDSFSFFNVAKSDEPKVMEIFESFTYQGRNVNVEITKDKGGRGGGGRDRSDRKKSGGFGKRRDSGKSNFSGHRKGKKSNVESSFNRRRSKKK